MQPMSNERQKSFFCRSILTTSALQYIVMADRMPVLVSSTENIVQNRAQCILVLFSPLILNIVQNRAQCILVLFSPRMFGSSTENIVQVGISAFWCFLVRRH